ncbi:MAG: hypothetical protein PHV49_04035 [Alistipes sp.]|nr:hypothetical protein [Alistipes sp.]
MKKEFRHIFGVFLLFTLLAPSLYGQHYIGIRGGWGGGSARFTPVKETQACSWRLWKNL